MSPREVLSFYARRGEGERLTTAGAERSGGVAMQNGGGDAAAASVNVVPAKRMRRPSVRLHQPYYENRGHRKLQQQWEAAKKPRTVKPVHSVSKSKEHKDGGVSDGDNGEEIEGFNSDDDVAIGNWKTFKAANRGGNFKSKRVRSSISKKCGSEKSCPKKDVEIEQISLSSGGESGEQEQEEDKNSGGNRICSKLVVENWGPYSPNRSFGNEKLSDDNVGRKQRGLSNDRPSDGREGKVGDRNESGVRMWLNELGLGKFASLFEVHGVDDEVLPLLTFEDLKDMGITEVGPRRKMYSSIQKLNKGLL